MKHLFVLLCVKLKHLFRCPVTIGNKTGNGFINLLMLRHKNLTLKSPKIHVSTSDHKWLQLSLKEWFKNRSRTKTKNKATSCIIPINHWKMPTIFSDSSLWICCWYIIHRMSRFSSQSHWASSTISSIMKTHVFSDFMCRCVLVCTVLTPGRIAYKQNRNSRCHSVLSELHHKSWNWSWHNTKLDTEGQGWRSVAAQW